jgi:hypothetical protein
MEPKMIWRAILAGALAVALAVACTTGTQEWDDDLGIIVAASTTPSCGAITTTIGGDASYSAIWGQRPVPGGGSNAGFIEEMDEDGKAGKGHSDTSSIGDLGYGDTCTPN